MALLPWYLYVLFMACAFAQNMAFTWVGRSRNSGDVVYHARAAVASNGLWFATQIFIVSSIWEPISKGEFLPAVLAGLLYTVATAAGSCFMMHKLLKSEKGLRRVGAYKDSSGNS